MFCSIVSRLTVPYNEKGKTGRIIKAVLQTLAGRKHQDGANLETVHDSNTTHVTPETVHTAATAHFKEWYAMPDHLMDTLHSIDNWRPHLQNYDDFRASYPNSKVPDHRMRQIFEAMKILLDDLSKYGPILSNRAPGQEFDVIGGHHSAIQHYR